MESWREELYHAMQEDALMHYGVKGMEWGKRKAVKTSDGLTRYSGEGQKTTLGKTNAEWAASRRKQNSFDPYKTKAQPYDPNNPVFFNRDNPREGERQEKLRVELERLNAKRRGIFHETLSERGPRPGFQCRRFCVFGDG